MTRTQVQLTDAQIRSLRELAASSGVSIAELIRQGVEMVLRDRGDRASRIERAIRATRKFRSGVSDVSTNHDRYLSEAFDT